MRVRRVSMVAVMAAVMATGVSVSITGNLAGAALVRPYPIYHVTPFLFPENEILSVDNVSSDGRFAVVQTTFGPRHVALPSGVTSGVGVDGFVADDGGVFAYRVGGLRSIVRLRLATGELTEFGVSFPTAGVRVAAVIDADASGGAC